MNRQLRIEDLRQNETTSLSSPSDDIFLAAYSGLETKLALNNPNRNMPFDLRKVEPRYVTLPDGSQIPAFTKLRPGDEADLQTGHKLACLQDGTQALTCKNPKYTVTVTPDGKVTVTGITEIERTAYRDPVFGDRMLRMVLADGTQITICAGQICGVYKHGKRAWIYDPDYKPHTSQSLRH